MRPLSEKDIRAIMRASGKSREAILRRHEFSKNKYEFIAAVAQSAVRVRGEYTPTEKGWTAEEEERYMRAEDLNDARAPVLWHDTKPIKGTMNASWKELNDETKTEAV